MAKKTDKLSSIVEDIEEEREQKKRGLCVKNMTQSEKTLILTKLNLNNWNISKTAQELGMTKRKLGYIVNTHGLKGFTNKGELAKIAREVVVSHMETFLALADKTRVEAMERLRFLIPTIKDSRTLLGIIEELTKHINGTDDPGTKGATGSLLADIQNHYTQININQDGKEKDIVVGDR